MLSKLKKYISLGAFTNKDEYKLHPFWRLRNMPELLIEHKGLLLDRLIAAGVCIDGVKLFSMAFDYYCKYPDRYDGNSGDEELLKIGGYKYGLGLVHDYLDMPDVNFTNTWSNLKVSDAIFDKYNAQVGVSSWNRDKRKLLVLVRPVRFLLSRKRRKYSPPPCVDLYHLVHDYHAGHRVDYRNIINAAIWIVVLIAVLLRNELATTLLKLL